MGASGVARRFPARHADRRTVALSSNSPGMCAAGMAPAQVGLRGSTMQLTEAETEDAINQLTIARAALQLMQREPQALIAPVRDSIDRTSASVERLAQLLLYRRAADVRNGAIPELNGQKPLSKG